MDIKDIIFLFENILKRTPNQEEIRKYANNSKDILIKDLSSCEEKIKILFSLAGERYSTQQQYSDEDINDFFTNNKFKVALCLSGHLRDYKNNLESINKFLVKPLSADVFLHTWDSYGKQKIVTENSIGPSPIEDTHISDDYKNYISNLRGVKIENNLTYLNSIEGSLKERLFYLYGQRIGKDTFGGSAEPKYIYSQFYSIMQSFLLAEEYSNRHNKKYDIVIKLRADYKLNSGILKEELEKIIHDSEIIFIPNLPYSNHGHPSCCLCQANIDHKENHHLEDVCDVFAYSNFKNMKKYMCVYENLDHIREYFEKINTEIEKDKQYKLENYKNYKVVNIWDKINYNINCFYPERIFRYYLTGNKLLGSKLSGKVLR